MADWTWHQGAIAGCSGRGAIAGCHCSVLWREKPTLGEWGWCHCWVPLQGAIPVCYGGGGRVTTNFGGVDVVPLLLGAIAGCQSLLHMFRLFSGPPISPRHRENGNEFCLELLADVTLFPTLITHFVLLSGVYAGINFFAILSWYLLVLQNISRSILPISKDLNMNLHGIQCEAALLGRTPFVRTSNTICWSCLSP